MNACNFTFVFCSVGLLGCTDSATIPTTSVDSGVVVTASTDTTTYQKDSSTNFYWEKLPIRTVADLILKDSIRPTTSPLIYKMLDSLTSDNKNIRQYYFKVFNKIMNKADGDLAETIGGYALTFVQNYPKEFLDNSNAFSKNQLEAWASNIGIEIYLASTQNVKEAFDHVVVLMNDNCKDCNANHRNKLKEFTNLVWRTIQENQQEKTSES